MLKRRCVAGVETLILRKALDPGTFCVPRAWTDLAPPSSHNAGDGTASLLEYRCLLSLTAIILRLNDTRLGGNVEKSGERS